MAVLYIPSLAHVMLNVLVNSNISFMKLNRKFYILMIVYCVIISCTEEAEKDPIPIEIYPIKIDVSPIPAGLFFMGSPTTEGNRHPDEILHQVEVSSFKMSKFEITNQEFCKFLNARSIGTNYIDVNGPYPTQALFFSGYLNYTNGQWVPQINYANRPSCWVNWFGASAFAQWAGGRLPTEAEWKYAARGGTSTAFSTGQCLTNNQAAYNWNQSQGGCPNNHTYLLNDSINVGYFAPNNYGLYDMHGNVWEWCSDWYAPYMTNTLQVNPTGPATGVHKLYRGGGFDFSTRYCRSADRNDTASPGLKNNNLGFRIVYQ